MFLVLRFEGGKKMSNGRGISQLDTLTKEEKEQIDRLHALLLTWVSELQLHYQPLNKHHEECGDLILHPIQSPKDPTTKLQIFEYITKSLEVDAPTFQAKADHIISINAAAVQLTTQQKNTFFYPKNEKTYIVLACFILPLFILGILSIRSRIQRGTFNICTSHSELFHRRVTTLFTANQALLEKAIPPACTS